MLTNLDGEIELKLDQFLVFCIFLFTLLHAFLLSQNSPVLSTDNVHRQISHLIFAPNRDHCVNCSSDIFLQNAQFLKLGKVTRIYPSFSWDIFSHMTR